jgi:hypothetical protein
MKKKTICMLSIHLLHDNRIVKYSNSFLDAGYNVINIHFGGIEYKEEDREIQFSTSTNKLIKRLYFYSGYKIIKYLKSLIDQDDEIIFHIHDPMVLSLSNKLKKTFFNSFIIYDRHEYFEDSPRTLKIFKEGMFYESISNSYIDLVVMVSDSMKNKAGPYFKGKKIVVVNNFPLKNDNVNRNDFINKKNVILTVSYVGSLSWQGRGDRDVPLMLKLADVIESCKIDYHFYIAGVNCDEELLSLLKEKESATQQRFQFLGQVSREKAIELTLQSHIGLFFLYPHCRRSYSPNKVYEYIYFGTIPIIRANIADVNMENYTEYYYKQGVDDEVIINDFQKLIENMVAINIKINKLLYKEYNFYWENEFEKLNDALSIVVT